MNELRSALLLVGALFIAGLFVWERRKRRDEGFPGRPSTYQEPSIEDGGHEGGSARAEAQAEGASNELADRSEPALVLPEVRAREVPQPLPVLEIRDDGRYQGVAEAEPAGHESAAKTGSLRLEWPEESQRQIIAARVVPRGDRFLGRSLRQALAGEGFVHGPLEIFHRAMQDGRVVLSAASLTEPGSFELATMDARRYAGLNLFSVLPGPLSGGDALEDLVSCARALATRLGGQVQDERGEPLTAARVAQIRASLAPMPQAAVRRAALEHPP